MMIYESEVQDFFFTHLLAAGVAAEDSDLQLISNIFFEYLIALGILIPDNIIDEEYDEE